MPGSVMVGTAGIAVRAANKGQARFLLFKARGDNTGNCYLGGSDVSAVDGMSLILGEIIQIELKDAIPTSQFWFDAANNGDQIDLIGNE
ncbi:MAG TPA: hypothetical protein EYG27_03885 [Dehalococcoidia bacterium]|nr:hypothetical protein [Dehalococcoidia bacterium]